MDAQLITQITACLPRGETAFRYAKDDYALNLLNRLPSAQTSIAHIKKTRFARLLNKPAVKQHLAKAGDGLLRAQYNDNPQAQDFILSLSKWGAPTTSEGHQISRAGYNLVLQLNFPTQHDQHYAQLVRPRRDALFNYEGHPVLRRGRREFFHETLAWARIDLDFHTNEALIEEIQSDWVREARQAIDTRTRHRHKWEGRYWAHKMGGSLAQLHEYINTILPPYARLWEEAILSASISFIRDELGIKRIFYHGFETGAAAKAIYYRLPPRSLYTELPSRFCFEKTDRPPTFLWHEAVFKHRIRRVNERHWFELTL